MLKYWLWLATRKGLGARDACMVARYFSSPETAFLASEKELRAVPGLRSVQPLLDKELKTSETILQRCRELGIGIITMQDAAYPQRLRTLDDAPVVLYHKGTLTDFSVPCVAVVGTRKASVYGMTQARRLSYGMAKCGCRVVSGGASGVDTQALRGALMGGGTAVAVLGCGLDIDYPKENSRLFAEVMQNGCLLSEYPPGTAPYRGNFPVRNRIISGISLGVLVTEAPARSGALITADHALEQGRDVFVIPANVGVDTFGGNLKLLRDGAIPVGDAWDILQEYAALYPDKLKKQDVRMPKSDVQPEPAEEEKGKKVIDKPKVKAYIDLKDIADTISPHERALLELLQNGAMHIDDLVEKTGSAAGSVLAALTVLEVRGIVTRPSPRMYELAEK
ncbi:MAG: DNA-processing protein DprA [Oscillospiraceae bacterium]|nr:DNA-processing protein DprA [Oscillospiraceae bacterium]